MPLFNCDHEIDSLLRLLVKKFAAFNGFGRFITVFKKPASGHCLQPDKSSSHHISLRSNVILTFHQRLSPPSGFLPSSFPTKIFCACLTPAIYVTSPGHTTFLIFHHKISCENRSLNCGTINVQFLLSPLF